jgi:acetolactate synthase I/II/III large subunit
MKLSGAEILCESLIREGVEVIFGFPGGALIPFYDVLPRYPQLRHILVRHEQAAAHAADAYARVTGKVGVCLATSGPGATNLVTGIANASLDSVPVVAITGQVARPFIGKDAFQEVDITGITLPVTKYNYLLTDAASVAPTVKEAFHLARTGRPGPLLIDVPKDVFLETAEFSYPTQNDLPGYHPKLKGHPTQIKKAARLIAEAKRPLLLLGRGVNISGAYAEVKKLAETAQIPVITTLLGIGCFPGSHYLYYGWPGMHGMAYANMAISSCDTLINIGSRFDDRVTAKVSAFAHHAKIVHVDIDPAEIGKNVKVDVPIVGDVKQVLRALNKLIEKTDRGAWLMELDSYRSQHPVKPRHTKDLLPQYVVEQLYAVTKGQALICTGVGQNQMWAAQQYVYDEPNTLITSGGLGTMGFGVPASLGAKVGCPDKTVWCIDGDGSFQMTNQELATMEQEGVHVKIAILNNGFLGMVRQWQDLFHKKNYVATPLTGPDFVKLAQAYGIAAERVTRKADVVPALERAMAHDGSYLVEFVVEAEENVFPMVPPGAALEEILLAPKNAAKTEIKDSVKLPTSNF